MGAILLGWVATSFVLATAVTMVPIGRLADILGRNKILRYGILLFSISSFLCAISQSDIMLISLRIIQGVGAAMIWGPSIALLTSVFPPGERGTAIGINTFAIYCGISLGPLLGGLLTQNFGWRSIFYFAALLGTITVILAFWRLRKGEWVEAKGERYDITGSLILIISLTMFMYGFTLIPTTLSAVLILFGIIGLFIFSWLEAKVGNPVLNVSVFRKNRAFILSNLAALIHYSCTSAPIFIMSLYLQYNKGFSPQYAGLVLVIQPVVMAAFAPIAGRISDRMEPLRVSAIGLGANCLAFFLLFFITGESSIWYIATSLVIVGFGIGFFGTSNTNAVMGTVDNKFFGVASGTVATMRHSGQVLSMGILLILFSIYIGTAQLTPEYYSAFLVSAKVAFIIFSILSFGGVFVCLAGGKAAVKTKKVT